MISISSRDGVDAVADDMRRHALGNRHDLPVDDEDAVIRPVMNVSTTTIAVAALALRDRDRTRAPRLRPPG